MDRTSFTRLRRAPGYPALIGTATLARLADEMFSVGVILLVLERTDSAALAGITVAAITLPSIATGPLLGAWLDISGRRRSLMVADQILISVVLVALVIDIGHGPDWTIPLIAFAAALTYPLSFGGFTSFVPVLVPDELLESANALETSSFDLALICGPALAGTISAVASPEASLLVQAALSMLALIPLLRIPGLNRPPENPDRELMEVVRAGLRHILSIPQLRSVTLAGALSLLAIGLLAVAFPFFAVESLGEPRTSAGYLWAAYSVGSIAGSLGLVRLARHWSPDQVILRLLPVLGALMALWPLASALPEAMVLIAVAGAVDGPILTATFGARQRWTPSELHGQVFMTGASLKVGFFAIGSALGGPLVIALGPDAVIAISAAGQFVAAAAGWAALRLRASRGGARTAGSP